MMNHGTKIVFLLVQWVYYYDSQIKKWFTLMGFFTCHHRFAGIYRNSHRMGRHMPGSDGVAGGPRSEFRSIRFASSSCSVRIERELAHFFHSQLPFSLSPRPDSFDRFAGAGILRILFLEKRKDALGFFRRYES